MHLLEGFSFKSKKIAGDLDGTDNPYAGYQTKEVRYQYMMGDAILVAPMFAGETTREVILPKGKWFDFYTGKLVGEEEIIKIEPGLDRIPLFVKDGGIIPMIAPQNQAPLTDEKVDLIIRHYGEKENTFTLYDDDGLSFDFEKGAFSEVSIKIEKDNKGRLKGSVSKPQKGKPFGYNKKVTWEIMTK